MLFKKIISCILIFIIAAIIIILVAATISSYIFTRPVNLIAERFNIKLPESSEIEEFTLYRKSETFYAKVLIEKSDINIVKDQFNDFFRKPIDKEDISEEDIYEQSIEWWDLNIDNVEACYIRMIGGKTRWYKFMPHSYRVSAFIVDNRDGTYYLYLACN